MSMPLGVEVGWFHPAILLSCWAPHHSLACLRLQVPIIVFQPDTHLDFMHMHMWHMWMHTTALCIFHTAHTCSCAWCMWHALLISLLTVDLVSQFAPITMYTYVPRILLSYESLILVSGVYGFAMKAVCCTSCLPLDCGAVAFWDAWCQNPCITSCCWCFRSHSSKAFHLMQPSSSSALIWESNRWQEEQISHLYLSNFVS